MDVNANCLKHLSRSFKDADHASWSTNAEGFVVRFLSHAIAYDVRYNHRGRWLSTIRYIPVEFLDRDIITMVMNQFEQFNIFFAQQLLVPAGSVYFIKIERGREWKTLKLQNGEIDVMAEYIKN